MVNGLYRNLNLLFDHVSGFTEGLDMVGLAWLMQVDVYAFGAQG